MMTTDQIEQGIEILSEKRVRDFKELIDEAINDLGGLKKIRKANRRRPIKFSPDFQEKLKSKETIQVITDFFKKYLDQRSLSCYDLFRLQREIYWSKETVEYSMDVDVSSAGTVFTGYGTFFKKGKNSKDSGYYLVCSFRCTGEELIKLILGVDFNKTGNTAKGLPVAMMTASRCNWSFCFTEKKKCQELSKLMWFICPWACVKKKKMEKRSEHRESAQVSGS